MFFFFLFLAFVFWGLSKFSKTSVSTIEIPIIYNNIPNSYSISKSAPEQLVVQVNTTGFQLLSNTFNSPRLDIDATVFNNNSTISVSKNVLVKEIQQLLGNGMSLVSESIHELKVPLQKIATKKVPIRPDYTFSFKEGFNSFKPYELSLDSIVIQGTSAEVASVHEIKTEVLQFDNLDAPVEKVVRLINPNSEFLSLETENIIFKIQVDEFVEKRISVPIVLSNAPTRSTVKIIPEVAPVTFATTVQYYNEISSQNFKIVANFQEQENELQKIPILLETIPSNVIQVTVELDAVDYLIFKE